MGGYAIYVWSVVGVCAFMIAGVAIAPSFLHKKLLKEIRAELEEEHEE